MSKRLQLLTCGDLLEDGLIAALTQRGFAVTALEPDAPIDTEAEGFVAFCANAEAAEEPLARLKGVTGNMPGSAVLIMPNPSLEDRLYLENLDHVSVLASVPSVDALAGGVARRLRPKRSSVPPAFRASGTKAGAGQEASLDELTELIRKKLRNGILQVTQGEHDVRLVIRDGAPISTALESFIERLKASISSAEPVSYDFIEALTQEESAGEERTELAELRFLLVDHDPARSDTVAQTLRNAGAQVRVARADKASLEKARSLDPDVVMVGSDSLENEGMQAVRSLKSDPRLRYAALVVVHWDDVLERDGTTPSLERISARLTQIRRRYSEVGDLLAKGEAVRRSLQQIGPVQLLRLLARLDVGTLVECDYGGAHIEVAVSEGLVVGARVTSEAGEVTAEAADAVARLLSAPEARVTIQQRARPFQLNLMLEVDQAVGEAFATLGIEPAFRRKSAFPTSSSEARTIPAPSEVDEAEEAREALEKARRANPRITEPAPSDEPLSLGELGWDEPAAPGRARRISRAEGAAPPVAPTLQQLRARAQTLPDQSPIESDDDIPTFRANAELPAGPPAIPAAPPFPGGLGPDARLGAGAKLTPPPLEEEVTAASLPPEAAFSDAPLAAAASDDTLSSDETPTARGKLPSHPPLPQSPPSLPAPEAAEEEAAPAASEPPPAAPAFPDSVPPAEGPVPIGLEELPSFERSSMSPVTFLIVLVTVLGAIGLIGAWAFGVFDSQPTKVASAPAAEAPSELPEAAAKAKAEAPSEAEPVAEAEKEAPETEQPAPEAPSEAEAEAEAEDTPKAVAAKTETAPATEATEAEEASDDAPAVAPDPRKADQLVTKGDRALHQGQYAEATALYKDALRYEAENNHAFFGLGEAARQQERFPEAIQWLERAVAKRSKRASYRRALAKAYAAAGEKAKAARERKALRRLEQ